MFLTAELISEGRGTKKFHILRLAEHEPGLPWLFSGKESAMQEMQVRSLGQEDPLEKETATYSGILAWEIPRTVEPEGLQCMGSQESDST